MRGESKNRNGKSGRSRLMNEVAGVTEAVQGAQVENEKDVNFPRKELDILSQSGIVVTFGEREYTIHQLRFSASRVWRQQLAEFAKEFIPKLRGGLGSAADSQAYANGFGTLFNEVPDRMLDLLKAYDTRLDWNLIAEEAFPLQIEMAFQKVMDLAFPFDGSIARSMGIAVNNPLLTRRF